MVIQNKLYSGVGLREKYGKTGLVAGASEGISWCFFFLRDKKAEHSTTRTLGFFCNMCLWLSTLLLLFRSRSRWGRRGLLGGLLRRRSSRRCRGCRLLLLCLLLATHNGEHEGHHEAKNKRCQLLHYRHLLSSQFYPERVSLPSIGKYCRWVVRCKRALMRTPCLSK